MTTKSRVKATTRRKATKKAAKKSTTKKKAARKSTAKKATAKTTRKKATRKAAKKVATKKKATRKATTSTTPSSSGDRVTLTLKSHPGQAVVMKRRVQDIGGWGHWLSVGPAVDAETATVGPKGELTKVLNSEIPSLGFYAAWGDHSDDTPLLFGTWDHPAFKVNEDGTMSSEQAPHLVLGFGPCHKFDQGGQERVVFVAKGASNALVFDLAVAPHKDQAAEDAKIAGYTALVESLGADGAASTAEETNAVKELERLAKRGNKTAVFGLCCIMVPWWNSADDTLVSCDYLSGGHSGAMLYKVTRGGDAEVQDMPLPTFQQAETNSQPDAHTVVFRVDAPADHKEEVARWLVPGKIDGIAEAVNLAASEGSTRFGAIWLRQGTCPDFSVSEYLQGGDFNKPTYGLTVALDTAEDAAAFGCAVAEFHGGVPGVAAAFTAKTGDHNPLDGWRGDMSAAMLEALDKSRSDELAAIYMCARKAKQQHVMDVLPRIASFLDPNSLMGRTVVGHGDLHGANMMRRRKDGKPGDLVLIDFDRVAHMHAANDLGGLMGNFDPEKDHATGDWPPLENRLVAARAYIDATPKDVVAACTRTSPEEVVFDMEAGSVMRDVFTALTIPFFVPGGKGNEISHWLVSDRITKSLDVLERARSDEATLKKVLEQGARQAGGTR